MRPLILVTLMTTTLLSQGCWVGFRERRPQQPIAHYQGDGRGYQRGPGDHDRRDDRGRQEGRRDDRRDERH